MQKICAIILLSTLASNYEAFPQTKWSRPARHSQSQLTRERRQFPFGDWIPLSQPCLTCRPFADPLDAGLRGDNIGLTPPRPPTVTRQIHSEGNFFSQDESSILSVPPPPPSSIPRHPITSNSGNFQFSNFGQQFNTPLTVPTQKVFPQTQQIQFLPQAYLSNQPLLVNGNQQILSGLSAQNNLFGQEENHQEINSGKGANFNSELKTQKLPENVVLEQNKKPVSSKQSFSNKPQPFTPPQRNQQQTFVQQQSFGGQQQHSVNFGNSILTPPPAPKNASQGIVIPGLDKEEIQLLYVPVETLRQRGTPQEQLLTQQPQNVQLYNNANGLQRPANNVRPTEQTLLTSAKGHLITQNGNNQGQADSSLRITSVQPFSTSVTPSTLLLQHLPLQQTPQPFVSATPITSTIQPFVTPASVYQKFSPFTPETTLPHLSTIPNSIQFSQSDIDFGTTPKAITTQGAFKEEIITGKPPFSGLKNTDFNHEQERPFQQHLPQPFVNQHQAVTQQPQLNTVFSQEQQKELLTQNQFPQQINQQQVALQKQQEHLRLLQQQRQKELDEQRFLEQPKKQKEFEDQRLLQQQQRQKELEEQRFLEQQRKQKELEDQRLLQQQQRQKELEQQRFLQKQKELEEQRLFQQQRQKELEQQRFLQKQKELEEQRLLQQRQKELEQQRFLQKQKELEQQKLLQQRQKELEEQRFLQEERQKELENQRRLQLQNQRELEEKRRLQLKQKEEEQRILLFQQQQKELEQQRLFNQQEEQQRLLQQQNQENLKKLQQLQFSQQQKQTLPQQVFHQANRNVLPANDKLNFIPQLEKESDPEDQQLVPHQPPLSVFFKGYSGAEARITDVLRELRSSNTITVLDQYFEKMPKVFVGPAGLIPPSGYGKFDLPYLSNLESNRIDRRIDKLPFFVAPLNFVPPPGYAKIPFPAPHIGSVVVSSEANPAMTLKSAEKGSAEEGSFPVVGPELPGLINNLDTQTTTVKPLTYISTPSLPQTTAQLRNRRPNSSLYKPQNRKPLSRTRSTTTSKPEEVTQPIQKTDDSENGFRKPFNRFLNRRRQQTKTTTESPLKERQDGKSLENRHYSVEVYHREKNQLPRTHQKSDDVEEKENEGGQYIRQFEQQTTSIDRITPSGQEIFEIQPTPDFSKITQTGEAAESEERRSETSDYSDINLQSFEDGPLPTGSAKTITQEIYRPNAINQSEDDSSKKLSKPDSSLSSTRYQSEFNEEGSTSFSGPSPTAGLVNSEGSVSEEQINVRPTLISEFEKQDGSSERYQTETPRERVSFTPNPITTSAQEQNTKGFFDSNDQYTSAFAEISKPHHIPGFVASSVEQQSKFSVPYPTPEISVDLQAPFSQKHTQEFDISDKVQPTQNSAELSKNKFTSTASSTEYYLSGLEGPISQQALEITTTQVTPTGLETTEGQHSPNFSVNSESQNLPERNKNTEDERIGSFISFQDTQTTPEYPVNPQQFFPSSTVLPPQVTATNNYRNNEQSISVEQNQFQLLSTPETGSKVTVNPSAQTYPSESASEGLAHSNEQPSTTDQGSQDADNFPNSDRLKLTNPSIVRVRTRVRNKSRGQVNFAASQTTTPVPFTRSGVENADQEHTTRINHFRDYNAVKNSKYNQFRNVKKPVRTTTEAATEFEHKTNVYTIRPQRRPLSPSTVSTKRIRRPTTPLPSADTATEAFGISTGGFYSQPDHSDFSPSGVSNDVYYEQSSLSPVKHKLRKHFGSAEQKNDFVPSYISTPSPSVSPTFSVFPHEEYGEESYVGKELTHAATPVENIEKYPEWSPSESGFDVSGIVLTTERPAGHEDQPGLEEPKKSQENKKAFDPDLEKKTGRRRVRVRVHKRPHENFETAESQNLRTVANVLVPPTTTYKPNDESNFHQLAKNADFSFGSQKLFGVRSREYFRKRLNLTTPEGISQNAEGEQLNSTSEGSEKAKTSGFVKKIEKIPKNDFEVSSTQSNENGEGEKLVRPKFRGFVRKIIKHGAVNKEPNSELNQVSENDENVGKHETGETHSRQPLRVNQGSFNFTGRANGTRHKTFVRYIKKNKIRQHETESHEEPNQVQELQKEEQGINQKIKAQTLAPEIHKVSEAVEAQNIEVKTPELSTPDTQTSEETGNSETQQSEATTQSIIKQTQQPLAQSTETSELHETHASSSKTFQESTPQPATPLTQLTGLYLTQRPKFYQTLRPVFQRTTVSGFQRTRESASPFSTTEQSVQEFQEKRNGFARLKYGKTSGLGTTNNEKSDEIKKIAEQQLKNKSLHALEVRKYLRTKNREGAFSQFSKNKYFSSEKSETVSTNSQENVENGSEETTEKAVENSSAEPKTTQVFEARTDSTELAVETTENDEDSEQHLSTTEAVSSYEDDSSDEDVTSSVNFETTTEIEIPTSVFQSTNSEATEKVTESKLTTTETTEKTKIQQTEYQPDIYRFSKNSFNFDEAEEFIGTKNRAHVRNITSDIIENTASFSAPGVEKRPNIKVVTHRADEQFPAMTESHSVTTYGEKTEGETTESSNLETTTDYPQTSDIETTASTEAVTKTKISKILKTSTTTKISHETEICYKGKCIRTKSENPDEDLKLLVDSASTMKIEKTKT